MRRPGPPCSILVVAGHPRSLVHFRGPLLMAMRAGGHEVAAAAPGLRRDRATKALLEEMGISCCDIPLSRAGMNPIADARLLIELVRLVRSRRPDVMLAYTMKAVIFGLLAARMAAVRRRYALISGAGYAFTGPARGRRWLAQLAARALYRLSLKHVDRVFFQNQDDASLFQQLGLLSPDVPAVIVNGSGIDLEQFGPAPLPTGPMRFLLAARLLTAKGIREFARAAAMVQAAGHEAEFHLVGGFDPNPDAIPPGEVKQWQRDGTLVWHGEVADIRPHIAACHVYVLPSYREGIPRSVLEAMAMGRPIVTTSAPGCRETVIHGHNGLLVPPRSAGPLAGAMETFLSDPSLVEQMGRRSRALAESKFDVREVNRRMLEGMELG